MDDKELLNKENRPTEEKEYTFIDLDYSKDLDIVKRILKNRIELYKTENLNMPINLENILTDNDYNNFIKELDGNISRMIDAIRRLINLYIIKDEIISDRDINDAIEVQKITQKDMDKLDAEPPKLYLLK